ncbi:hypothetical protein OROMI_006049 [Orobanche minor]
MSGRLSGGRQRIPMRRIESQDDLYATFSKRRIGLYKKASELSTLCGADVGIIIFSPTDNPFSFWHPSMESVIQRYRNLNKPPNDQARVFETNTRARITYLNRQLDELLDEKEQFKEREKRMDDIDKHKTRPKGCCEEIPVESLNKEQVREWQTWFQDFNSNVKNRINELKNGASSSSEPFQQQKGLSMFHQDVLLGPSYEPYCTGITSQFIGHNCAYNNNIPPHGHIPAGYYGTADAEYPSVGGVGFQLPNLFSYFPPHAQDRSTIGAKAREASTSLIRESSVRGVGAIPGAWKRRF